MQKTSLVLFFLLEFKTFFMVGKVLSHGFSLYYSYRPAFCFIYGSDSSMVAFPRLKRVFTSLPERAQASWRCRLLLVLNKSRKLERIVAAKAKSRLS